MAVVVKGKGEMVGHPVLSFTGIILVDWMLGSGICSSPTPRCVSMWAGSCTMGFMGV